MSDLELAPLQDTKIDIKLQLSALWTSTVFCYLYCDYFELFEPGKLESMLAGDMDPLGPVSQLRLLLVSFVMIVPCLMVFLSIGLSAEIGRWLNIIFGSIFTVMLIAIIPDAWNYYRAFAIVEVMLTSMIVWNAWKWPRAEDQV